MAVSEHNKDSEYAHRLRQDPLFADITGHELARLVGAVQSVEFSPGQSVCTQDDPANFLYLIESGELLLSTASGRSVELTMRRCGEEAASDHATYLCGTIATTPVRALRVPRETLQELSLTATSLRSRALLGLMGHVGGEPFLKSGTPRKKPAVPLSRR